MKDEAGREYSIEGFIKGLNDSDNIVIFGAGKYGLHIYEYLKSEGISVNTICDNNRKIIDFLKDDYPVKYVEDLNDSDLQGYFIIGISRLNIVKIIKQQLENMGIGSRQIIIPLPGERSGFFDNRIMIDDEYCMFAIREMWNDLRRLKNNHIRDYFETNELYRLIVFEHEMVAGWLDEDLRGTKASIIAKLENVDDYDDACGCDAIVIMNELKYEIMEEQLMTMTNAPIISIWDVLKC